MLVAKAIFKEDGTLIESQMPNIVVGDKDAVKLNVSFYEDYDNSKLLDLSNYVVEAIFERPDGKVSPALLLSIDIEDEHIKYLKFGGWLTEIAGISKITVRIKQNGTVKATGFLPLTIQDANVPTDTVITEPQYDALTAAIMAEEQARVSDVQDLNAKIDNGIAESETAYSNLEKKIRAEEYTRQSEDLSIYQRLHSASQYITQLEEQTINNFNIVDGILQTKLGKVFTDIAIASDLALTDYLVINTATGAYRITVEQLQHIISQKTDYYKGQFSSLEDLNTFRPSGEGGDYAYVDTPFEDENGNITYQFVMYVWDVEDARWEETKSSQYLGVTTFQAFQESLINGTFKIGAIEANVSVSGITPLLTSLKVNGVVYSFPAIAIELSNEKVNGAYELKSIKINGGAWNIPSGSSGGTMFNYASYGLPVLYVNGDISTMTKDDKVTLNYVYGDKKGTCTMKWQGNSSLTFPKKNYTIVFDNGFEAKEGWGEQKKYCLKADWVDFSHCRNVVSAKLWGDVVRSRNKSELKTKLSTLPNCGAIDGFPCFLVINNKWEGIYNFNIPKEDWMFGMGEGAKEAILCSEYVSDATYFLGEGTLGDEFELEYASDNFTEEEIQTSLNTLINAVKNSDGSDIDTIIAQYVDIDSAIDYLIFAELLRHYDGVGKNYLLATYNGVKWFFSAYDLDLVFGLNFVEDERLFSTPDTPSWTNFHKLFALLYKFKFDKVQARYKELVNSVMSKNAVYEKFTNYATQIPLAAYNEETKIWEGFPNTSVNNIFQIIEWYGGKLEWLKQQEIIYGSKGLTYNLVGGEATQCTGLGNCSDTEIVIAQKYYGKDVTEITANAFDGYTQLKRIVIPEGVLYTRNYTFARCSSVEEIVFPDSLTLLGYALCLNDTALKVVKLPANLKTVSENVFKGCTSLARAYLPKTTPKLAGGMFNGCTALKDIFYDGTMAEWNLLTKTDGWNNETGNYTIHCSDGNVTKA